MKHLNILITGATGAIGSELLEQLVKQKDSPNISVLVRKNKRANKLKRRHPSVKVYFGDVTHIEDVKKAAQNQNFVIHLAGVIPPLADEKPKMAYHVNVEGTRNIINALEELSPSAFLLFSSSVAIYGDRLDKPDIRVSDELTPVDFDLYAKSKIECERLIKTSKLSWSIFRLSAIMGIGNHKVSKIMFHVPLDTPLEIATVRDTATAFINAIKKQEELKGKTFNLGGGENCRISYSDFLNNAFKHFGLGKANFPKYAFAKANFHCGNMLDSDELEKILEFRTDTIETYFNRFGDSVPGILRIITRIFRAPVKWYLLRISEPYRAYKKNDIKNVERFFGERYP